MNYDFVKKTLHSMDKSKFARTISSELLSEHLHPLTYFIYMQNKFSDLWLQFEPETVKRVVDTDHDRVLSYHGPWSALLGVGGMLPMHAFENMVVQFSDRDARADWDQEYSVPELCDTLSIIDQCVDVEWRHDVKAVIYSFLRAEDFEVIRPEYEFILDLGDSYFKGWADHKQIPEGSLYEKINDAVDIYIDDRSKSVYDFVQMI